MQVTTNSGARFETFVDDRRGSPENPVGAAAVEAKFRANVRGCLTPADADRVVQLVGALDRQETMGELVAILARAASA